MVEQIQPLNAPLPETPDGYVIIPRFEGEDVTILGAPLAELVKFDEL
jgi:hypothetical protein